MNRKELEERILRTAAAGLTVEQFDQMKRFFSALTDEQFSQYVDYCAKMCGNVTMKDIWREQRKANLTWKNNGLNRVPLTIAKPAFAKEVWRKIYSSVPSDHICLTEKEDDEFMQLWEKGMTKKFIPSDIFFAGTVPLMDCRITIDETAMPGGVVVEYRVVIFPDYAEQIEASRKNDNAAALVGAVVMKSDSGISSYIPMMVVPGEDAVLMSDVGYDKYDSDFTDYMSSRLSVSDMYRTFFSMLETWYGIQIALLHPLMKTVFSHQAMERVKGKENKAGNKRVRYIKKHVIKKDELENAKLVGDRNYSRHTLVWYVIGHWRVNECGTKSFVQPYWKGPMRNLKMSVVEREREVLIGGVYDA